MQKLYLLIIFLNFVAPGSIRVNQALRTVLLNPLGIKVDGLVVVLLRKSLVSKLSQFLRLGLHRGFRF